MRERLALGSLHWAVAQGDEDGMVIALCGDEPGKDSVSAADAHLMAAAPALLAALKAALPYLANHIAMTLDEGPGDRIAYDKAEAAIALAEGGSNE